MSLPWWGWVAFALMVWCGIALIVAPVIGKHLANRDHWQYCPACGRELIGTPPEHRLSDRAHCYDVQVLQRARAAQRRSVWRPQ